MSRIFLSILLMISFIFCSAQNQEIILNNPSFEDIPHQGIKNMDLGIRGWYDCGALQFPNESPPDIHPVSSDMYEDFWGVTHRAIEGNTYLGMVVRDNDSWESVSQRLSGPLVVGKCYEISAYAAISEKYLSGSKELIEKENRAVKVNYTEPAVLRLWGGTGVCGRQEILSKSRPIGNTQWDKYTFKMEPERNYNYITLEAFYEVPVLFPYNGHILLDNLSEIKEVPCEEILALEIKTNNREATNQTPSKTTPSRNKEQSNTVKSSSPEALPLEKGKVSGLGFNEIKKGQVIKIENLYFNMDKSTILKESYSELDRLYQFLTENKGVRVEIGGHTNTVPPQKYCMELSESRARSVATYLIGKGIPEDRIKYKGYGKSKPIIFDDKFDMEARRKNQRVEVKILELGL